MWSAAQGREVRVVSGGGRVGEARGTPGTVNMPTLPGEGRLRGLRTGEPDPPRDVGRSDGDGPGVLSGKASWQARQRITQGEVPGMRIYICRSEGYEQSLLRKVQERLAGGEVSR